jgi:hypothetical protein
MSPYKKMVCSLKEYFVNNCIHLMTEKRPKHVTS